MPTRPVDWRTGGGQTGSEPPSGGGGGGSGGGSTESSYVMPSASYLVAKVKELLGIDYWDALTIEEQEALMAAADSAETYITDPTISSAEEFASAFAMEVQWGNLPGFRSYGTWSQEQSNPAAPPLDPVSEDIRAEFQMFLRENELPETLMAFIQDALVQGMGYNEILLRLRETPEYQAAYPENALRLEAGYEWWSEAQIRAYRSEARRLVAEYLGITNVSNDEIADLIAGNVSLSEWERKLYTFQSFERWGPVVKSVLESELGFSLDDERVFAFMSADIPTPELDRAYEMALLRGQPASIGLGVRPEDEAELLRQFGISPEQAFQGYQGVVGEMPRVERLAAIEAEINRDPSRFPNYTGAEGDLKGSSLFRAIFLGDPTAQRELQGLLSREIARHQSGGGPTMNQGGALVGLLTDEERSR